MKIAIPSDNGTDIAGHTGRCAGFVIFEVADGQAVRQGYRPNTHTAHAQGRCQAGQEHSGGHHASHATLLDALGDCGAVVVRGLGPRLVADLTASGIEVHVCTLEDAEEAARRYAAGQLPRATGSGTCDHR